MLTIKTLQKLFLICFHKRPDTPMSFIFPLLLWLNKNCILNLRVLNRSYKSTFLILKNWKILLKKLVKNKRIGLRNIWTKTYCRVSKRICYWIRSLIIYRIWLFRWTERNQKMTWLSLLIEIKRNFCWFLKNFNKLIFRLINWMFSIIIYIKMFWWNFLFSRFRVSKIKNMTIIS